MSDSENKALALPAWAKVGEPNPRVAITVLVDSAAAYKIWHKLLKVTEPNQYSIEVAHQCIKMDVQAALVGTEFDPRTSGKSHLILMSNAPDWTLAKYPPGRGLEAATKGREARDHYKRIRGAIPFA